PGEIKVTVTNVSDLEPIRRIPELFHSAWAILIMLTGILAILLVISVAFLLDFSGTVCLRFFGVLLFVTGACCYAIKVVAVSISTDRIATADLPSLLTADTLTHMVKDTLAPAGIWGIVIGLIGIALFVASFFLFRNRGANA
ncbi:MAG: hypothetical protein NTU41_03415, partial [Chloroflexi bacterium]|nr:hypothetical protein [Chloroflexota bacterium]